MKPIQRVKEGLKKLEGKTQGRKDNGGGGRGRDEKATAGARRSSQKGRMHAHSSVNSQPTRNAQTCRENLLKSSAKNRETRNIQSKKAEER